LKSSAGDLHSPTDTYAMRHKQLGCQLPFKITLLSEPEDNKRYLSCFAPQFLKIIIENPVAACFPAINFRR
jgi:hypothetical protein